ncbi:MAG: methyltransferase domain-containing protein, partial [Bradyrhizobium sp.]|nr:methyltransferase domain-containing protein [Bradyrhizobium sp.]
MSDMFVTLGTWNWLIFGIILMALELLAPGVFLFWLGLAALLVGLLSFAYEANSYDLIASEFTLHHLPDFWKAVALARIYGALKPGAQFFLRDIVYVSMPDGAERSIACWRNS